MSEREGSGLPVAHAAAPHPATRHRRSPDRTRHHRIAPSSEPDCCAAIALGLLCFRDLISPPPADPAVVESGHYHGRRAMGSATSSPGDLGCDTTWKFCRRLI